MDISVIWTPDRQSQERMRALRSRFARAADAEAGAYPHITLGSYYDIPFDPLNDWARACALCMRSFIAHFTGYVLLNPSCLAIEAAFAGGLRAYYDMFHQRLEQYADRWTRRETGLYLPHSTLLNEPGVDMAGVLGGEKLAPFDVVIEKIQLSRIYEGQRYEILSSFELPRA